MPRISGAGAVYQALPVAAIWMPNSTPLPPMPTMTVERGTCLAVAMMPSTPAIRGWRKKRSFFARAAMFSLMRGWSTSSIQGMSCRASAMEEAGCRL